MPKPSKLVARSSISHFGWEVRYIDSSHRLDRIPSLHVPDCSDKYGNGDTSQMFFILSLFQSEGMSRVTSELLAMTQVVCALIGAWLLEAKSSSSMLTPSC